MSPPNTTPSAEEIIMETLRFYRWDWEEYVNDEFYKGKIREILKSYKKEILEEVERKLTDQKYMITGKLIEGKYCFSFDEVLDLLNSLK